MRASIPALACAAVLACGAPAASSRSGAILAADASRTASVQTPAPTAAEREQAALAFAREHHPELAALLEKLQERGNRPYREALAELEGSMRLLARLQRRAPEAHPHALEAWKLRSRARLLAARLERKWSDEGLAELRRLLLEAEGARRRVWAIQAEKLERQAERLRTRAASDPEISAERELKNLRRKLRRGGETPQERKR